MYSWHTYCKNGQKDFNPLTPKSYQQIIQKKGNEKIQTYQIVVEILISHQILILSNLKENV